MSDVPHGATAEDLLRQLLEAQTKIASLTEELTKEQSRRKTSLRKQKELQLENAKLRHHIDVLEGKVAPTEKIPPATLPVKIKRTMSPKLKVQSDSSSDLSSSPKLSSGSPPTKPLPPTPEPSTNRASPLFGPEKVAQIDPNSAPRLDSAMAANSPSWRRLRIGNGPASPSGVSASSVQDIPERSLASSMSSLRTAVNSPPMVASDSGLSLASSGSHNSLETLDAHDTETLLFVAIAKGDLSAIEASEDPEFVFMTDGSLKAASLDKLIALLPCNSEPYYLSHFLITYRSLCSSTELFSKLQTLWDGVNSSPMSSHELELFRIKFMNVLKTWIDKHFYDFTEDLIVSVQQFLDRHQEEIGPVTCHSLKKLIKRSIEKTERRIMFTLGPAPPPIVPVDLASLVMSPSTIDSLEIARQMTLRDEQIYKAIRPRECMNQAWNKPSTMHESPNILKMIDRFNKVSNWVQRAIVSEPQPKLRKSLVTTFITIAQRLRELHNFHSLLAVIAALESAAVTRMKKTWELVKSAHIKAFQELKALMSAEGSYKAFRLTLRSVDPPSIPYIGVYLADLTFIEDGNPDRVVVEDHKELINFAKMHLLAKVIDEIRFYQQEPYIVEPVPRIQAWLEDQESVSISEKELYDISLKSEPRASGNK